MTVSPRRARRASVAVLTAAATCGALALTTPAVSAAPAGVTATSGSIRGAAWAAKVPAAWNGTVLLFNHGIRTTLDPNRAAELAPTGSDGDAASSLLARGYALLGSSYRSNGFAVRDAVNDDLLLLASFKASHPGRVKRTYVWGASLGGLITETLAEEHPGLVAGAAPACGVLAGAVPIADQVLDTLVMTRAFFAPTLKVAGYATDAEALKVFNGLKATVLKQLSDPATQTASVGKILAIATLQGLPYLTSSFAGRVTSSQVGAATEGVLTQAGAAILGSRDSMARTGGNYATNVGTLYIRKVNAQTVARFSSVGLGGNLLRSYALTLDRRVLRLPANPVARQPLARRAHRPGQGADGDHAHRVRPVRDRRQRAAFCLACGRQGRRCQGPADLDQAPGVHRPDRNRRWRALRRRPLQLHGLAVGRPRRHAEHLRHDPREAEPGSHLHRGEGAGPRPGLPAADLDRHQGIAGYLRQVSPASWSSS